MENWKPVVGYEDRYEVSDQGRVRSLRVPIQNGSSTPFYHHLSGRVLKPGICSKGYLRVRLQGSNFRVHRLVLTAFDRPPAGNEECAHLDGDPSNNKLSNLEWKSPVGNMADKARHGRLVWGENSKHAKLTNDDVVRIRELRSQGLMWKDIHDQFPTVSRSTVIEAGTGQTFRHLDGLSGPSDRAISLRNARQLSTQGRPDGGN